jgi:hypothetical protein
MREAHVIAGPLAFDRLGEVTEDDLLEGIRSLRCEMITSTRSRGSTGFNSTQ